MLKLSDFNYDLPEELIAQSPLDSRSDSRMMVIDRKSNEIHHKKFTDVLDYLNENDCLVINDTKVIPARLLGQKDITGAAIEVLLLKRIDENKWEAIVKPGKKLKINTKVIFGNGKLKGKILEINETGNRIIEFIYEGIFEEVLDELGQMPLPPYITKRLEDSSRYQTVYAKNSGSAAAPTAGLHFTDEILDKIINKKIKIARITLHVGLGTFRPVKTDNILEHHMHSEYYEISKLASDTINETIKLGGKVISVGTTSTRTLETVAEKNGKIVPESGNTEIFIYPGYQFKVVDCQITNFHLPESTLIMLVSALYNKESILSAYKIAVEEKYRFFSFGDCMLIL